MKPVQKILMSVLWVMTVLIMVSVIGASLWRRRPASEVPVLSDAPAFSLVDQDSKPLTLASMAGKPFVADFIFTHCAGPCPIMTAKMAALTKDLPGDIHFVSFSVDPERDTPTRLKEYAKQINADESRWHFLTGRQDAISAVAAGMM